MRSKIYLVQGHSGEYELYSIWPVGCFFDPVKAGFFVKKLNKLASAVVRRGRINGTPEGERLLGLDKSAEYHLGTFAYIITELSILEQTDDK